MSVREVCVGFCYDNRGYLIDVEFSLGPVLIVLWCFQRTLLQVQQDVYPNNIPDWFRCELSASSDILND